jgi:hypothetical protein
VGIATKALVSIAPQTMPARTRHTSTKTVMSTMAGSIAVKYSPSRHSTMHILHYAMQFYAIIMLLVVAYLIARTITNKKDK